MERIVIDFRGKDELFTITIFKNDENRNDGYITIKFKNDGKFNIITEKDSDEFSMLSTKFNGIISCAGQIYESKINSSAEDYATKLKHKLIYELVDTVAEYAGHHYISTIGIENDPLFSLTDIDYAKYTVYKDYIGSKMYDIMLVKVDNKNPGNIYIPRKTYISVYDNGDVSVVSEGNGVDLPMMGTDQFMGGDKKFLDMRPADKVEYIKEFSKLISKHFDVVLK